MATSLEKISGYLDSAGLQFRVDEGKGHVATGVKCHNYRNLCGDLEVRIYVELSENGEYIKMFSPACYSYRDGRYKAAVFQVCLMVSWMTKMLQFEYDSEDGEIRAIIEFPLEVAELTGRQLLRCIHGIAETVDKFDASVRIAMKTGEIQMPETEDRSELLSAFQEFLKTRKK